MSIRSRVGDYSRSVEDSISNNLNSGKASLNRIVGSVATQLSNLWTGGFTGMNSKGMAELTEKIEAYCKKLEDSIAEFDEKGNIDMAFKGQLHEAAADFIAAIKQLLQAYVSTMRQEIKEANDAYNDFNTEAANVQANINEDITEIQNAALEIRLD